MNQPPYDLINLIFTLVTWFISLGAVVSLIYFLIGGFNYITSGGDRDKLESARNSITLAVISLIVIFASFLVFSLLSRWLNIDVNSTSRIITAALTYAKLTHM